MVSAVISRLLGLPHLLLRWDPTLGASVLEQGMGEGLSSQFSGQVSGKWYVHLLRLLIVANDHGLQGRVGGTSLTWHVQGSLEVTIERERGGLIGINS